MKRREVDWRKLVVLINFFQADYVHEILQRTHTADPHGRDVPINPELTFSRLDDNAKMVIDLRDLSRTWCSSAWTYCHLSGQCSYHFFGEEPKAS